MVFTITHPNGKTERRQHIPYTITQAGPAVWEAHDKRTGRLIGRSYISEQALRAQADTHTEAA